jgi:diguanylate cyclase
MSMADPPTNADVARKVLRLMTAHSSDYRPRTYLLWHEFVLGRNPELGEQLEKVIVARGKLSAAEVDDLYSSVVDSRSRSVLARLHRSMQQLIDSVIASTATATNRTTQFGSDLEAFEVATATSSMPQEIVRVVEKLSLSAQATRTELDRVSRRLEQSEKQVNQMAEDLRLMREEAHVDPLSGLFNRRRFASALAELVHAAVASGSALTLLMIDIDRFKALNDRYGHVFGDQAIVGVSQAIKASVKGRDVPARFGGDEFALILPETTLAGGIVVAEYVRRIVGRARMIDFATNDLVTSLTLSIGVAALVPGDTPELLLQRADAALYRAKHKGRDCVVAAE